MPRVIHFEIPAEDPEKSIAFYQSVFGWQFQKFGEMDYWLVTTPGDGPGINGGLMRRNHPDQPVTNVVDVENLDETCRQITELGGEIVFPRHPIPGVGYLAYFKDPSGYITGVMQPDPNAA